MEEKWIRIDLPKCRIYLTQAEVYKMLNQNREIYMQAIKRGKMMKRKER